VLLALDRVLSILLGIFATNRRALGIANSQLQIRGIPRLWNGYRFQTVVKSFSAFMKLRTGISTTTYSKAYLAVAWRRDINFKITRDCRSVAWQLCAGHGRLAQIFWGMLRCMHKSFRSSPSVSGHYEPTRGAYVAQFI
jgi:hypothetical protein